MQASSDTRGSAQRPAAAASPPGSAAESITFYHWLVVFFASCGWLFDCMGQRIFVLSREPALRELLGATASDGKVKYWGGIATLLMMVGWATGGILFGMMSDRYGRVKAMVTTLLAYTIFSGLSGFSRTGVEFLIFRFLFGLGVGGMFGAATTLVAESVPRHFRTLALGSMQALSAFGNMIASGLSLKITPGMENFWGHYSGWQVLSFVSVFPGAARGADGAVLEGTAGLDQGQGGSGRPAAPAKPWARLPTCSAIRAGAAARSSASAWASPAWWACGASRSSRRS